MNRGHWAFDDDYSRETGSPSEEIETNDLNLGECQDSDFQELILLCYGDLGWTSDLMSGGRPRKP